MRHEQVEAALVGLVLFVGVVVFSFGVGWGFAQVIGWVHDTFG